MKSSPKCGWLRSKVTPVFAMIMAASVALSLSLLQTRLSHAQEYQSFQSKNYHNRYIRHRNSLGYIDIITKNDKLARNDATFRLVKGLANTQCRSFESLNYPDHFLRHQNYRLKLAKRTNEQLFKEDATFCVKNGLSGSGRSFESSNFPDHYIRHSNFELWIAKYENSALFKNDASFIIGPPLSVSFPGIIDE